MTGQMMKKRGGIECGIGLFCMMAVGAVMLSACGKMGQKSAKSMEPVIESEEIRSDFEYPFVAESENGYYFWERMSADQYYPRLMFLDKASGRVVPLCNKPDCMHDGKACNSYFPNLGFGEDGIDKHYLQYYEGSLYAVGVSSDNYVALFRISVDGSDWEVSTRLYRADYAATGHWRTLDILIEDGYVYFIDTKQKKMQLARMPIGGKTAEVLFEGDSDAAAVDIFRLECNEDDGLVFFQARVFTDESFEHSAGGLYQYDAASGQCSLIKSGLSGPYTVRNGEVYYGNEEGLCCYSIQDAATRVLVKQPMDVPSITLTREHIILCDGRGDMSVYDYEGTQTAAVSGDLRPTWYFGGNSELLFAECAGNDRSALCFLDLTRPAEELQWEELKEN